MIFSNKKINSELKEQLIKDEKIMADLSNFLEFAVKQYKNFVKKEKIEVQYIQIKECMIMAKY